MYKLRIQGLPEYDNQLSTMNFNEIEEFKAALIQRVSPEEKQARVLDLSSVIVEMPDGESWILTNRVNGVRHSYVDTSRSWQQYIEDYGDDPADYDADWYSVWKDSQAARDVETIATKRAEAGALMDSANRAITLHQDDDPTAPGDESEYRALRVECRAFLALDDTGVLATDVPVL